MVSALNRKEDDLFDTTKRLGSAECVPGVARIHWEHGLTSRKRREEGCRTRGRLRTENWIPGPLRGLPAIAEIQNVWMNNPLRSFGSNHVLFGGMI
jgi:hypothetical protein